MIANPDLNSSAAIGIAEQRNVETFTGTNSYRKETTPEAEGRSPFQDLAEFEEQRWGLRRPKPKALPEFSLGDDQSRSIREQSVFATPEPISYIPVQKPYEISEVARDFINRQKRSVDFNKALDAVSTRIYDFMKIHKMKVEMKIDVEIDTEFDDWMEPRIKILVKQTEIERAYGLFDELLNHALHGVRKREMKRFRITLDVG